MFDQFSESDHGNNYSPLNVTDWRDQHNDTADNPIAAWHSLGDSTAPIKPGGIGLGNLHRKGANYKPITDEAILQQRLRQQQPSTKNGQQPKPKKVPTTERPEVFANRQAAGGWGSGKLLSVPFWEQPSSSSSSSLLDEQQTPSATPSSTTSTTTLTPITSSILPTEQPLLHFNIKLAEGITISFIIRKGDDIETATDNFISDHRLHVSPEARKGIVRTVAMVYEAKLNSIQNTT
ncbi:hypothetical protein O0I10_001993 [Lichtheimia ornata]|uniref:Uncharacterized protein n=1 Tax=Lichtheimia ornata TaxID=688661 RepID=A0AAD7Y152_9FUNG|nr:uncharacterized protein O0I10_001993 [Lichtheimia ornata]KAJ8662300.1 hypothetical protein O0I10_001993 [Lichtheimia ornata]